MAQRFTKIMSPLFLTTTLFLTSCGLSSGEQTANSETTGNTGQQQANSQSGTKASYPDIKTMVLDILHSKEGMNTLKDTISSPEFKHQIAITPADISTAVEKTLNQGQNKAFLATQMKDTQFAAAVVKAAKPQMTEVQKQLMKDPEYQKSLLSLMASPENQQTQFHLLQSPEYRKEIMKIMTEALQQPTFRLLFMDSMKEAVKSAGGGNAKQMTQQKSQGSSQGKSGDEKGSGGGSDQGDSSGGGSEGSSESGS